MKHRVQDESGLLCPALASAFLGLCGAGCTGQECHVPQESTAAKILRAMGYDLGPPIEVCAQAGSPGLDEQAAHPMERTCAPASDDNPCASCIKQACCKPFVACLEDDGCRCVVECRLGDRSASCAYCGDSEALDAALTCTEQQCGAACPRTSEARTP